MYKIVWPYISTVYVYNDNTLYIYNYGHVNKQVLNINVVILFAQWQDTISFALIFFIFCNCPPPNITLGVLCRGKNQEGVNT